MNQNLTNYFCGEIRDYGPEPLVIAIDRAAESNTNFRTAFWTGSHLQVTLMCIPVGGEIGLEVHEDTDQLLRIVHGCGMVQFGATKHAVRNIQRVNRHSVVIIPAGTYHNLVNCGSVPLQLYSLYAPPHHPFGTVHRTKADADRDHA